MALWSSSLGHRPPSHHLRFRISSLLFSWSCRMASVISSRNGEPGQAHEGISMGPTTPNPTCPATSPSFYPISSHNSQERGQASPSQWQLGGGYLSGGCHSKEPTYTGLPAGPLSARQSSASGPSLLPRTSFLSPPQGSAPHESSMAT